MPHFLRVIMLSKSNENNHSRNGVSKWEEIIKVLPTLTEKELKSVKPKDYAIALLINEIKSQLDEYDFHLNYFNNRSYIYQDNFWNEISLDKVELFLRDCAKKYYQNEIKYHTESFYKPLGESFKKEMKVLTQRLLMMLMFHKVMLEQKLSKHI